MVYFFAVPAKAGPAERNRFVRACYRGLVGLRVLADPRAERARRQGIRQSLLDQAREFHREGLSPDFALREAKIESLIHIGYDESLVRRWAMHAPEVLERVLWHPKNKPITGYHGVAIESARYSIHSPGFNHIWSAFYFSFEMNVPRSFAAASGNQIGIIEKYQLPQFGWGWTMAQVLMSAQELPMSWPSVTFARDPSLFTTHLQFPEYSQTWYPVTEVICDTRLVLPAEIDAARRERQFNTVTIPALPVITNSFASP